MTKLICLLSTTLTRSITDRGYLEILQKFLDRSYFEFTKISHSKIIYLKFSVALIVFWSGSIYI